LQHWIRTEHMNWRSDLMQMMLESKHKNIEDKEEKKKAVWEDYITFIAFYKDIDMN
jgi:hypothetical protein